MVYWLALLFAVASVAASGDDPDGWQICRVFHDGERLAADCSHRSLTGVPVRLSGLLRSLLLHHNNLTTLPADAFKLVPGLIELDLSHNTLLHIDHAAFAGLSALRRLDLSRNRLCLNSVVYPPSVFAPLTSLTRLSLVSSRCTAHTDYPDKALRPLATLRYLAVTGLPGKVLGAGFSGLAALRTLVLGGSGCDLRALTNATFETLRGANVTRLSVRNCRLASIDRHALVPLAALRSVNLACNRELELEPVSHALRAVRTADYHTLILDNVHHKLGYIPQMLLHGPQFAGVRRLSLRHNRLTAIDVRILSDVPRLRHLVLSYNPVLVKFNPAENTTDVFLNVSRGMDIRTVDRSHLYARVVDHHFHARFCAPDVVPADDDYGGRDENDDADDADDDDDDAADDADAFFRHIPSRYRLDYVRKETAADRVYQHGHHIFFIPPTVQVLFADRLQLNATEHLKETHAEMGNHLVALNMSHDSVLTSIDGQLLGFVQLQLLDMSDGKLERIWPRCLQHLFRLRYLLLAGNRLGRASVTGAFDGLHALELLDLSRNGIGRLDRDAFRRLTSLRELRLAGNPLTAIDFDLSALPALRTLDLSGCRIASAAGGSTVPAARRLLDIRVASLQCGCPSKTFLAWYAAAVNSSRPLQCAAPPGGGGGEGGRAVGDVDLNDLQCSLGPSRAGVAAAAVILPLALIAAAFAYRHRVALRVWAMNCRRSRGSRRLLNDYT